MNWFYTHSGLHFDFADPQPDQIDINDIICGLSRECRFAGQIKRFYSVAEHSIFCSELVPQEFALEALLHDASEAYCSHIPPALKELLPDYQAIERRVDSAIRAKFALPETLSPEVMLADRVASVTERHALEPFDGSYIDILDGIEPLPDRISLETVPEEDLQKAFLAVYFLCLNTHI